MKDSKPGVELDCLVAEARGWQSINFTEGKPSGFETVIALRTWIPTYSTSISDAWELVEELHKESIELILLNNMRPLGFVCHFSGTSDVDGVTAPHAISLAYLEVKGK